MREVNNTCKVGTDDKVVLETDFPSTVICTSGITLPVGRKLGISVGK